MSRRRAIQAWCLYDFANSPFTTLVVTFIYATYFTQAMAKDEIAGTSLWARGVTVAALLVALVSPPLGAAADIGGYRKRLVMLFTAVCVTATAALYWVRPGQALLALVIFVVANVGYELAQVFYNAFLPELAPPGKIGRISGYGWGLGYVGGLLSLAVALLVLVQPDPPWFGFSTLEGENIRATNLLAALWLALFSLPLVLFVREQRPASAAPSGVVWKSYKEMLQVLSHVRRYPQPARFLLARLFFNDGLVTIFAFGGIYAAGTFGFDFQEILMFGILINVAAGAGAFAFGHLDDRFGALRTLRISLVGLIAATLLALLAPSRGAFWLAGLLIGIFSGPNQSAGRSLMGRLAPAERRNEFYGFYAFSGKATAFAGPLALGILTEAWRSQRAGVVAILVLFVAGLLLLSRVNEAEGIAAAGGGAGVIERGGGG